MKKQNMRILCLTLACALTLSSGLFAADAHNWYCKRQKDHIRPTVEPQMKFIERYDCAFLGSSPEEKVIYLTFDAGYENGNVARILDTLKAHNAPGAFFVLAHFIRSEKDLICRMAQEGHLICNHTVRHRDMTAFSDADFKAELTALETVLREETGLEMAKFYRPPEGRFCENNLKSATEMGYKTVFWSLAYADWDNEKQPDPEKAMALLDANIHNGAIVLLHPTSKTNADILDRLLTKWESEGYRFGSLDELADYEK